MMPTKQNEQHMHHHEQQQQRFEFDEVFARKNFRRIDRNQDGELSVDELHQALLESKLPTSRKQVEALHRAMDIDGSGGVDMSEFLVFAARRQRALQAAFAEICNDNDDDVDNNNKDDNNSNGGKRGAVAAWKKHNNNRNNESSFSASQLRRAAHRAKVPLSDRDVRNIMLHIDRDGDGLITYDDFLNSMMLIPHINPHAFFDTWFVDAFADDAATDFTVPREARPLDGETFGAMIVRKLVCGGAAGMLSRTLTAPVDRIRLLMMTSQSQLSIGAAYSQAVSHPNGFRALWIGNGVNCIKIAPEMAIKLLAFDLLKANIASDPDNITASERFVAGGCAGAIAEMAIYPLDVMRTRMAMGSYPTLADGVKAVYNNGGIRAFYAGLWPSLFGIFPYAAVDLTVNSILRDMAADRLEARGQEVSVPLLLSCGMTSSATAAVLTFPINVVRTQQQATAKPIGQIIRTLRVGGIQSFYKGIVPCLIKVMPATAISYTSYEWFNTRWTTTSSNSASSRKQTITGT